MNPILILELACAFLFAGVVGEGYVIKGQHETIKAKTREVETITKDRDAQAAGLQRATEVNARQHAEMDALDAKARAAQTAQQASARDLAVKLAAATDEKNALFAQLQEDIDARPQTITVTALSPDGWDPVVVSGMRRLRCVQLAATGHQDTPDCRVSADTGSGRSGLAGDPTGAAYPRPSAKQQLDFLAFAWSLREWGASCYDDKRAIAAAQTP